MLPRIKAVVPKDNYLLLVEFEDGRKVIYDVKDDIESLADFRFLQSEKGLFPQVRVDSSRTCVFWTDRIDLPSDIILKYGKPA